ncbi:MAG: protein-glutamate O-methyltransferase [Pseudomonadota bacterium]
MPEQAVKFVAPEVHIMGGVCITDWEFQVLAKKLLDDTGINLTLSKKSMIEGRLSSRLRELSIHSFKEYIEFIKKTPSEGEVFINALTTNKTDFFREPEHFNYLTKTVLPEFLAKNPEKKFRLWSGASSTGEEIYTLSIVLNEFFGSHHGYDYKIVGTDIDTEVLDQAKAGIYARHVIQCVRPDLLAKYFKKVGAVTSDKYEVSAELKRLVKFRQFNLLKSEFQVPIKFDVIFLRNVLIYFLPETIEIVIKRMYQHLKPGGYLFLGHSEALTSINHSFKYLKNSIYVK